MNDENTYYVLNPDSIEEMTRLERQGALNTEAIGLLPLVDPNLPSKPEIPQVLDIGCGPGEWARAMAIEYDKMQIIGIDISEAMIKHATARAKESKKTLNVRFMRMNALKLDFPDETFDLIHMRTAIGFIPREQWLSVFQECKKKLRPGGVFLSTEGENGIHTDASPNTAHLIHWLCQVIDLKGLAFWDKWSSMLGIHGMQRLFFQEAGFENIQKQLFFVDASYGTKQYFGWRDHHATMVKYLKPIICKSPELGGLGVSEDEFEAVLDANYEEVRRKNFVSYSIFQAVSGQKPVTLPSA